MREWGEMLYKYVTILPPAELIPVVTVVYRYVVGCGRGNGRQRAASLGVYASGRLDDVEG